MGFIGVDGEGLTKNGTHLYTLLGASNGRFIENYDDGLHLEPCLEFLLSLKSKDDVLVGFSFDYDVNMIVKNHLSDGAFESLRTNHVCHIKRSDGLSYRIEHAQRKFTTISLGMEYRNPNTGRREWFPWKRSDGLSARVRIFDVWGFFQSSFIQALLTWNIATKEELQEMDDMKKKRGSFDSKERNRIREYNQDECIKLVTLMDKVKVKMEGLGLNLKSWHGAGAVASEIYKKFQCKPYLPKSEHEGLLHSYFGGRIQALQLGHFDSVFAYDIRSAYPFAMSELPLFENREPEIVKEIGEFDLCKISWNIPGEPLITPFPYRLDDDSIQYYTSGSGWYHACEVLAALPHYGKYIHVEEIRRIPHDAAQKPFGFIQELYAHRAKLRALGDEAHIAVKLGLNSLYGKCAQKHSYRGRPPTWRSYQVAGYCTAKTRAMMFSAAMTNPASIVMFATDGIASTKPLDLPLGEQLGLWDESHWDEFRLYQAGMYWHRTKELPKGDTVGPCLDSIKAKTRSVHPSAIDWDTCKSIWDRDGVTSMFEFSHQDFITYGIAGHKLPHGEWIDRPKNVSLKPNKGIAIIDPESCIVRLGPLPCPFSEISSIYAPD